MTPPRHARAASPEKTREIDWPAALAEHQRWLRTVVVSRVNDAEATDELLQELALCVVQQADRPRDTSKVAPWLYRIAIRRVLLYRRRCGRQRRLFTRYAEHAASVMTEHQFQPDPLVWLLADERRQLVRDAMQRLPERDVQMLLLKYTEGWSYDQIALHLGVSRSAVESRLHRARARLRSELMAMHVIEAQR